MPKRSIIIRLPEEETLEVATQMTDRTRRKEKPQADDLSWTLTPDEIAALRRRFGVQLPELAPAAWDGGVPAPARSVDLVCAFCGGETDNIQEVFDGKHCVAICEDCANLSLDDDV